MLRLEVRSPHSKPFHGDKFAEVMSIDYDKRELTFVCGYNKNTPILYIQQSFNDTEFRLHENKSQIERN